MKICKVEGCNGKCCAKGLCSKHYMQMRNHGRVLDNEYKNEIIEYEDYAEVILYNRNHKEVGRVLIDLDDVELVGKYKWYIDKGYAYNKQIDFMHRLIMNYPEGMVIDHINHNKLDNRKCNLRICTSAENSRNRKKQKGSYSSKYKGVYYDKQKNKWRVRVCVNNKPKHIGYYESEEEGVRAYDRACIKYHKEFCNTNFPIEDYTDYIFELGYNIDDFIR